MDTGQERDQWTHEEVVTGARRALVSELAIEDTALGEAFVASAIGPRVRVGGVRASLARFAVEQLAATGPPIRYGGFTDASDEVTVHLPAAVEIRDGLALPTLSSVQLKLGPLVSDLAA